MQIPSNSVIHCYEGRIGTLSSALRGAPARPSMSTPAISGIHGYAARYFNSRPLSYPAAKTSSPTNGMPTVVTHPAKPAYLGFAGMKPKFSSNSPTKDTVTLEAKCKACGAETKAKKSALEHHSASEAKLGTDRFQAWKTKFDKDAADFSSLLNRLLLAWIFIGTSMVYDVLCHYHEPKAQK